MREHPRDRRAIAVRGERGVVGEQLVRQDRVGIAVDGVEGVHERARLVGRRRVHEFSKGGHEIVPTAGLCGHPHDVEDHAAYAKPRWGANGASGSEGGFVVLSTSERSERAE